MSLWCWAFPEAELVEISQSKAWLRHLHYKKTFGGFKSELDGKSFFFAKDGKFQPLNELKASLAAFHQPLEVGKLKLHPQCAFPERFRFIKEAFPGESYRVVECPLFEQFSQRFHNPSGVSLVFSSAYPNNPASMFGHTFLKIHSERKNNLLDMGLNFAAYTPTDYNMLAFMYKGVFGGYPGLWSIEPYYKKVNEYVNAESRDLWEFELHFSKVETLRLIAHIWELEVNSYFDYYFFDENCSYQILKAIEVVKLDIDISQFPFYVIPAETIKKVTPYTDLVKAVHFRPSLYHQTQIKLNRLDSQAKKHVYQWLKGVEAEDKSPQVLDTVLTGLLYKKAKLKKKWTGKDQAWENYILDLQAANVAYKANLEIPDHLYRNRPDLAHHPSSVYTSLVRMNSSQDGHQSALRWRVRSSYHDLMARDEGFSPFNEIQFPWVEMQWNLKSENLHLRELGILSTTSLFPLSHLEKRKSWRIHIEMKREDVNPCLDCLLSRLETGWGGALGGLNHRLYALALAMADFHADLDLGYRLRGGFELGWIGRFKDFYKWRVTYKPSWQIAEKTRWEEATFLQSYQFGINNELRQNFRFVKSNTTHNSDFTEFTLQYIKYFH